MLSCLCFMSLTIGQDVDTSNSFARGMFLGQVQDKQVLPFPQVLDEEQRDMLAALVDPTESFFEGQVDSRKNDELGFVPEETLNGLKVIPKRIPEPFLLTAHRSLVLLVCRSPMNLRDLALTTLNMLVL